MWKDSRKPRHCLTNLVDQLWTIKLEKLSTKCFSQDLTVIIVKPDQFQIGVFVFSVAWNVQRRYHNQKKKKNVEECYPIPCHRSTSGVFWVDLCLQQSLNKFTSKSLVPARLYNFLQSLSLSFSSSFLWTDFFEPFMTSTGVFKTRYLWTKTTF